MADVRIDMPGYGDVAGITPLIGGFSSGAEQYPPGVTWELPGFTAASRSPVYPTFYGPARAARHVPTADDVMYNRIWFDPNDTLDLGAITGTTITRVPVWNSFLRYPGVTVSAVNRLNLETDIIWDDPVPRVWKRLEYRPVDIKALALGAASVNGRFEVTVTEHPRRSYLHVVGVRAVAFCWPHNWAKEPTERAEWLTKISTSEDGHEQARTHRHHARRGCTSSFVTAYSSDPETNKRSLARFEVVMAAMQGREFVKPLDFDAVRLPVALTAGDLMVNLDTIGRDYEPGSYVVLFTDPTVTEVVNIASVTDTQIVFTNQVQNNWPANRTIIAPGRLALMLSQQNITEHNGHVYEADVEWEFKTPTITTKRLGTWTAPTYRTFPVWTRKPQLVNSDRARKVLKRDLVILDNQTGVRQIEYPTPGGKTEFQVGVVMVGRSDIRKWFGWLWQQRGAQKLAWYPTWKPDLFPVATMPNDQTLVVTNYGESTLLSGAQNRQDVEIVTTAGVTYRRRITVKTDNGDGTQDFTLDSGLGVTLAVNQIDRISWLRLAYLSDKATWTWQRPDALTSTMNLTELVWT